MEDRWSDAVTKRDQYGMELVLAPQFIGISASGDVTTRNQQIAGLFVKGSGPDSLEQKVISVRFVGDVAIVNGTYVMSWKTEKGPVQEKGIFSHVFEHVHNNWLCLNSQRTVVAEDMKRAAQEKPKSSKHSDAALPMHIPLVYKGPDQHPAGPSAGHGTHSSVAIKNGFRLLRYSSLPCVHSPVLLLALLAFANLAAFAAEKMTAPELISLAQAHSASLADGDQRHVHPQRAAGGHGVGRQGS